MRYAARATGMSHSRLFAGLLRLGLPFALAACGGGAAAPGAGSGPAAIHTLAYVVSQCRENDSGSFASQAFVIREGERDPVTVTELPEFGLPLAASGTCRDFGLLRKGDRSVLAGAFTRVGVSRDGSAVVFEETDEFSLLANDFLTPEHRGIFVVGSDGTGLHRVGDPSREPPYSIDTGNVFASFAFSPDGRTITFPDRGPSPTGEDASQVFTLDLVTGVRAQVTHFPLAPPDPFLPAVLSPVFLDSETIGFATLANPDGLNPQGKIANFTVKVDGSGLKLLTPPVAVPGAQIVPIFAITGDRPIAFQIGVPGMATGPPDDPMSTILELFVLDGPDFHLLQLTNFGRTETGIFGTPVSADGKHVFFAASGDPLGTNPSENCQLFAIDRLGADLRQLTNFQATEHSENGCNFDASAHGCVVQPTAVDATTQTLVFSSGCDPFGANPSSEQIFALRPDGSGLRQLTNLRGLFTEADGTVHAELAGPSAYGPSPQ